MDDAEGPASDKPVELVLNGHPLWLRHKGVGSHTARLLAGLARQTPERRVRVLLPEPLRHMAVEFPATAFDFVPGRPPLPRAIVGDIYWSHRIVAHARRNYPDAIFYSPAELWSPQRPQKTVITLHDCIYRHFPRLQGGAVRRWWWRATERYARNADLVLTVSEHSKRELLRHAGIPERKLRVSYLWVDGFASKGRATSDGDGEAVARYGLPPEYVLYVGGYNINKNIERLVAAYALACGETPLPPLVLAGDIPPANPRLAVCDVRGAIAAAGLPADRVRMIGKVETGDLPVVMRRAKLLVHPSLHEGFGYPPAEAMAVGTPVIVSDVTSLVEVVRERRCRFDPTDVGAIARKLVEACARPQDFRCPLPVEFTEKAGIASYLAQLDAVWPKTGDSC